MAETRTQNPNQKPSKSQSSRVSSKDRCPTCKGLGVVCTGHGREHREWFPVGTPVKEMVIDCPDCSGDAVAARLRRHSGLEPQEQARRLEDWLLPRFKGHPEWVQQRVQAGMLIDQALTEQVGLYTFWGDFGAGKTLALQIIINELRERYALVGHYATFAGVLQHLRSLYSQKADTSYYWERLLKIPALALDEVTRSSGTDWAQEKLFLLADTRYRMRATHLTLFATNDDPTLHLETNESRGYLFSRMREGQRIVRLQGDMRGMV